MEVSAALAAVPMPAGGLFALPISPPIEHGLRKAAEYAWRKKGVDRKNVRTYTGVRDVTADGVIRLTWKQECRAVWRLPSTNLRLAHSLQKRAAVTRWGGFLDGLTCPVQVVVRATLVDLEPVLRRIAEGGSSEAIRLASFLKAHAATTGLVQRERYLVVGASDEHQLADRVRSVEDSLTRAGLAARRVHDEGGRRHVLRDLIQGCWSPAPDESVLGPRLLQTKPQHLNADGELSRTVVLSAWPRAVGLDWLSPVLDGSLPIDVALHIEPQDTERICARLDTKLRQCHSSAPSAARDTAIEDAETLRRALERRHEHAFSVGLYFLVRASTEEELERRTRRLRQLVRELGGRTQLPRWEHTQGLASCVPTGQDRLRRRTLLDTSTVARTYPASNSTLVLEGGVPWGVTAHTPVVFTPFHSA